MTTLGVHLYLMWFTASSALSDRLDQRDDRGEVTATTAIIVLLVAAAITAGGIIANKLVANANAVPTP